MFVIFFFFNDQKLIQFTFHSLIYYYNSLLLQHGTYALHDKDGRKRIVEYVADKKGFRAKIHSNEPGLQSHHAAHAHYDVEHHGYHGGGYDDHHGKGGGGGGGGDDDGYGYHHEERHYK